MDQFPLRTAPGASGHMSDLPAQWNCIVDPRYIQRNSEWRQFLPETPVLPEPSWTPATRQFDMPLWPAHMHPQSIHIPIAPAPTPTQMLFNSTHTFDMDPNQSQPAALSTSSSYSSHPENLPPLRQAELASEIQQRSEKQQKFSSPPATMTKRKHQQISQSSASPKLLQRQASQYLPFTFDHTDNFFENINVACTLDTPWRSRPKSILNSYEALAQNPSSHLSLLPCPDKPFPELRHYQSRSKNGSDLTRDTISANENNGVYSRFVPNVLDAIDQLIDPSITAMLADIKPPTADEEKQLAGESIFKNTDPLSFGGAESLKHIEYPETVQRFLALRSALGVLLPRLHAHAFATIRKIDEVMDFELDRSTTRFMHSKSLEILEDKWRPQQKTVESFEYSIGRATYLDELTGFANAVGQTLEPTEDGSNSPFLGGNYFTPEKNPRKKARMIIKECVAAASQSSPSDSVLEPCSSPLQHKSRGLSAEGILGNMQEQDTLLDSPGNSFAGESSLSDTAASTSPPLVSQNMDALSVYPDSSEVSNPSVQSEAFAAKTTSSRKECRSTFRTALHRDREYSSRSFEWLNEHLVSQGALNTNSPTELLEVVRSLYQSSGSAMQDLTASARLSAPRGMPKPVMSPYWKKEKMRIRLTDSTVSDYLDALQLERLKWQIFEWQTFAKLCEAREEQRRLCRYMNLVAGKRVLNIT